MLNRQNPRREEAKMEATIEELEQALILAGEDGNNEAVLELYALIEEKQSKDPLKDIMQGVEGNSLEGTYEGARDLLSAVGTVGSGLLGSIPAGYAGLYQLLTGKGSEEASNSVTSIQNSLTNVPRSQRAGEIVEVAAAPVELGAEAVGYVGEKIGGAINDEQGAIAGRAIGEAAVPMAAVAFGGLGGLKAVKGAEVKIPLVSGIVDGIKNVARTKSPAGIKKLAEDYLKKQTTPKEAVVLVEALESGREIVPYSPVTSADAITQANQATIISGNPKRFGGQYVALQEGLSKLPETSAELVTIKLQQEFARNKILETEAGTTAQMNSAVNLRKVNADKNYSPLMAEKLVADSELSALLNKPSMEIAFDLARKLAKEKGTTFEIAKYIPETTKEVYNPLTQGKSKVTTPEQFAEFSGDGLQTVKLALDKMIAKPQEYAITTAEVAAIKVTRASLISWFEKNSATYARANKQYAIDSLPINQMNLWGVLRDKFQAPTGKESPGVYMRMLRDESKAIKEATGYKSQMSFEDIFDTRQSALANRLAVEMENTLLRDRMASEVSSGALGSPTLGIEPTLPNMLMRETMVANFFLRNLAAEANVPVNIVAAQILADKAVLANILKQVKPDKRAGLTKTFIKIAKSRNTMAVVSGQEQAREEKQ